MKKDRKKTQQKNNSGFIALMTAIIISVILLLITANLNLAGFYGRSNILDSELKEKSLAAAEGCADIILLRLAGNSAYTGGETVTVSEGETCNILPGASGTNPRIFTIQANPLNYYTNLRLTVDSADSTVVRWEEI